MTVTKGWEWRESSQHMSDWIARNVEEVQSAWDKTDEDDPIAVMGLQDSRTDWIGAITSKGNRGMKVRQRPDVARRYFITRAKSPVGNFFEKKDWSRQHQIEAFRNYVWSEWLQKGDIPVAADKWLRARAAEVNAGKLIDLVSDSRIFSRKRRGFMSRSTPYDCHGHVIRAMILIMAGKVEKEQFFDVQAEYLLKMECNPATENANQKPARKPTWVDAAGLDRGSFNPSSD